MEVNGYRQLFVYQQTFSKDFGTSGGWVDDRILICEWTVPLRQIFIIIYSNYLLSNENKTTVLTVLYFVELLLNNSWIYVATRDAVIELNPH